MAKKLAEIANFQSKLEEFAAFTEAVFQGNNESYKEQLFSKVGHFFRKRIDSCLPTWKLAFPIKRAEKETVKIDLPNELWIKILGFMKTCYVLKNFALTCKRFHNLSLDPSIIKSLYLSRIDEFDLQYVTKVIKRSKFMAKIKINQCKFLPDILSTSLESSHKLKTVTIKLTSSEEFLNIDKILQKSGKNLEFLSLESPYGNRFKLTEATVTKLTSLKALDLKRSCTQLNSKTLIALAKNAKIESLNATVICDYETNLAFETFVKTMGKTLKNLSIVHSGIRDHEISWPKYLKMCQTLQNISIKNGSVPTLKGINELNNLKFLKLNNILDSDPTFSQEVSTLFEVLDLEAMEKLAIWNMNITLENFSTLANRQCPKLKDICFIDCEKLKLDEKAIGRMISNFPQLERIHMRDAVVDLTIEQLYQLMERMEQIGVVVGVGYGIRKQLEKYKRYHFPKSEKKHSRMVECVVCEGVMKN